MFHATELYGQNARLSRHLGACPIGPLGKYLQRQPTKEGVSTRRSDGGH